MTVPSATTVSGPFTLNGVTTTFGYGFRILDEDELEFVKFATSDGTLSVLTPDSFTGVGEAAGGNCVFNVAPSGGIGWVRRKGAMTQPLNMTNFGPFFATSVMAALDRLQMYILEVREEGKRALRGAIGEEWDALVAAAYREEKVVTFDANGELDLSISRVDVSTVASLVSEIEALGALSAELTALYNIRTNITTVAGISSAVSSLAAISSAVSTCASNITAIQNASTHATNAANSATASAASAVTAASEADAAATSETNAAASASSAASSASTATTQATNASNSATAAAASATAAANSETAINQALSGVVFEFDSGTADADPGAGNIRFNNATFGSITQIFVSETDDLGAAVGPILDSWDDSTSSNRAYVIIRKRDNPVNYVAFYVTASQTDAGVYRKFTVSYSGHSGSFSDGDVLGVIVERTGDVGPSGPGSGDVVAANAGSEYGGVAATFRGNVSAAPRSPEYLVGAANSELSAERVVTDTATIAWDLATGAQAKAGVVAGSIGATQLASDAVTTVKIADGNVTLAKQANLAASRLVGRGASGGTGVPEVITVGNGLEFSGAAIQRSALTGDVTASAGSNSTTIANDAVTFAKMQNAASAGFIGATGAGDYSHRTYAQTRADLDLEAGTDFEAYASALSTGVVEIFIPAGAMTSRTTNGAGSSTAESSTNKVMQVTKDFDQTTQEFVQFTWFPPKSWNLSTVSFIPVCIPAGSSGGWVFGMAGVAISNDDVVDAAFGTAQTSTDSFIAATDIHVGPESSAITIAGTPAAADFVVFQINRTVADGSDTHNGDVKLLGIKLRYTINAKNDT